MQNINEKDKVSQMEQQYQEPEGAKQTAPSGSRLKRFMGIAIIITVATSLIIVIIMRISDSRATRKQLQANYEKALNSPEIQELRSKAAKRNRELAKQRRLRQMHIDDTAAPEEKNDLLNAKLKEAREREEMEQKLEEQQNVQSLDYSAELAAYNAKMKEVEAEEARIRAEQEAKIKAEQERIAARERADAERRAQLQAQQEKIKAAQEKAAKAQAAREKAAKAKAQAAKVKTQKQTEKKVLQTTKSTLSSTNSSFKPK